MVSRNITTAQLYTFDKRNITISHKKVSLTTSKFYENNFTLNKHFFKHHGFHWTGRSLYLQQQKGRQIS